MRILRRDPSSLRCRKVRRLLNAFLDDEIDATLARRVAAHLEVCEHCGFEAETYRAVKRALTDVREDLDPEIIERLERFVDHLPSDPPLR